MLAYRLHVRHICDNHQRLLLVASRCKDTTDMGRTVGLDYSCVRVDYGRHPIERGIATSYDNANSRTELSSLEGQAR
jgi:hypothetical protein